MKAITENNATLAKRMATLSLPILAGQAFGLLYNLVDTWFIARIDTSDPWLVGATGLVFPLYFIVMATSFGITGGVSSLVARAIGAGREDELDRTAESGMFLGLAASALFLALMYPFATPLLALFGGSGKILEYGLSYLLWLLPVVPFMFVNAVFTGILQGEGRTKHMMVSMMIGTVANIILDPVLIFTAGMGIGGAGLATAIGNLAGTVYLVSIFVFRRSVVRVHWKISRISLPVVAEILRVGIPQSLMNFLASISFIFYNRIMISIEPMILTAFTLYSRLEQLALIPVWSLSSALAAIAGQAAGARDFPRMRSASRIATQMGLAVSGTLYLVYVLSSGYLFSAFQTDARVLELAAVIVPWMSLGSVVAIPVFMVMTVMSTAGFASRSLALTAVRIYAFNVPACAIGAYVVGKSLFAVMVSILISSLLSLALALVVQSRFYTDLISGKLVVRLSSPGAGQSPATGPEPDVLPVSGTAGAP